MNHHRAVENDLKNIKWYTVKSGSLLRTPWQSIDRTSMPLQGAQVGSLIRKPRFHKATWHNQKRGKKFLLLAKFALNTIYTDEI